MLHFLLLTQDPKHLNDFTWVFLLLALSVLIVSQSSAVLTALDQQSFKTHFPQSGRQWCWVGSCLNGAPVSRILRGNCWLAHHTAESHQAVVSMWQPAKTTDLLAPKGSGECSDEQTCSPYLSNKNSWRYFQQNINHDISTFSRPSITWESRCVLYFALKGKVLRKFLCSGNPL